RVLALNHDPSVGHGILGIRVFVIGHLGDPMRVRFAEDGRLVFKVATPHDGFPGKASQRPQKVTTFEPSSTLRALDQQPVRVTQIPSVGDWVSDDHGRRLELTQVLGTGGEGTVFLTSTRQACKVYSSGMLPGYMVEKLALMAARPIHHRSVCWPQSVAFNAIGEPIGYLMRRAQGVELKRGVFIRPLLEQYFPEWDRSHLVQLTRTILSAFERIHRLNVLIGDINARNILIKSAREVFLVDCDSYQLAGYPCPVGVSPYLAPELYGKSLRSTLRRIDSENFSVATLVFMLIHPGKPPYSHQGGGDPSLNVKKRHFPYPLGEKHGDSVPGGVWRYMWSHLPYYMKQSFHRVFVDDDRLSLNDWRGLIRRYSGDLAKGYVSKEIYPSGFKELNREQAEALGWEWKTCRACQREFGTNHSHHSLCKACFRALNTTGDELSATSKPESPAAEPEQQVTPAPLPRPSW
ncbi:MAG: hypothetical protein AAFY88_20490, partial [Acidobacteriota bacterium]